MKYIFKEYKGNYDKYEFPYKIYLQAQEADNVDGIYSKGFLPTRIKKDYYYLSRNIRINLENFEFTSENRRVLKKTQNLTLESKKLENFEFDYDIGKMALDFFKQKFREKITTTQKLKWLFTGEFFNNVLIYRIDDEITGYCITMETENVLHYSYPFYKPTLIKSNIGMGMILKAIEYAKKNNKKLFHLGTVYTKESLYKLQFNKMEWFDGEQWNPDVELLKEKIKNEE
jgi:arginyl-tRNA--protein-N-Asp/Glu arginylyltransferase